VVSIFEALVAVVAVPVKFAVIVLPKNEMFVSTYKAVPAKPVEDLLPKR
jgi:hypothetical protein